MEDKKLEEYYDCKHTLSCGTCSKIVCPDPAGKCLKYSGVRLIKGFDHLHTMFEYGYEYWTPKNEEFVGLEASLFEI